MGNNILSLHNVSYRYPSGILALDSLNIELPEGKKIALLGGNGAGKSTLMFLLNGILKPTDGYLVFEEEKYCYKKSNLRALRSKVGFLFQDSDNQLIAPTVYEEISFGLNNISKDKDWVRMKIDSALTSFCLEGLKERAPHELSAGQKKRVCLASILAMQPKLLICDEPTSNLDPWHTQLTFNYLNNLHEQGKTILIATHDVNQAYEWADYVIILKEGKAICSNTPKEVFSNTNLIMDAGLNLPFVVETYNSLFRNNSPSELPANISELKTLLKVVV